VGWGAKDDAPKVTRVSDLSSSNHSDLRTAQVGRMMSWLLALEWASMIVTAIVLSPRTWSGAQSHLHPHLWAAILAGPAFILPAILLAAIYPTRPFTRHTIAVAQMLVSALLIDITGGHLETHFHIFGSLAFLAFYRDWKVLMTASAVTAANHLIGGILWPEAIYGVLTVSPWRWVEHVWWVVFEDCFLIVGVMREGRLDWNAYHDVLTGLGNQRLLGECYDALPNRPNTKRALIFIDLDHFKRANDVLGPAVGDKMLIHVAQKLAKVVGSRALLARVRGDEFVASMDNVAGPDEAIETGNLMLSALSEPFRVGDRELMLSASAGISLYPDHATDLTSLQECAEIALYFAKRNGRNACAMFSTEIGAREKVLQEIRSDLYWALPRGEFNVHFQPLVDHEGRVASFEALLRWTHPVHGPVGPADFIPMAEKAGLITKIGQWVLMEACRQCRTWQRPGRQPVRVGVNVSAVQFELPDFQRTVMDVLRQCDLDPALLTLELTEGILVKDLSLTARQLEGLRALGIRISLDDFGTGYSSLSYLASMPVDTVKLDRSFLSRNSASHSAIVQSVVALAHGIGMRVVVEGVETLDQSESLKALNCDELQGFYFSSPIPADAVAGWLDSFQADRAQADPAAVGQLVA
jgi:diguanylate cyclase (GGDEF)-like protein